MECVKAVNWSVSGRPTNDSALCGSVAQEQLPRTICTQYRERNLEFLACLLKVVQEAAHKAPAAQAAQLAAATQEIVEFLNRIGFKNVEKWLLSLRVTDHTSTLLEKFSSLMVTLDKTLSPAGQKLGGAFPSLANRDKSLRKRLADVKAKCAQIS